MRRNVFSALVPGALGVALAAGTVLAQVAAPPPAVPQPATKPQLNPADPQNGVRLSKVAAFVGPETVAVAHLDLSKVDWQTSQKWVDQVVKAFGGDMQPGGGAATFDQQVKKAQAWTSDMRKAGADHVFVVLNLSKAGSPPAAAVVVPVDKQANADTIRKLLTPPADAPESAQLGTAVIHNAVVLAEPKELQAFQQQPKAAGGGQGVQTLEQAMASVGSAAGHVAFIATPAVKDSLRQMMGAAPAGAPQGVTPQGDGAAANPARTAVDQVEWMAIGFDAGLQGSLRFVAKTATPQAADQMAADARQSLAGLKQNELLGQTKDLDRLIAMLTPKAQGDRVTLTLSGEQLTQLAQQAAVLVPRAAPIEEPQPASSRPQPTPPADRPVPPGR